jgi:hypothetical protein
LSYTGTPQPYNVRLRLARYYNTAATDYWETTALPRTETGFGYAEKDIGELLTRAISGYDLVQLDDCYIPSWNDHMVGVNGQCGNNAIKLRTLGWVFVYQQPNTKPIYRCFNSSNLDHFISDDLACEGKGSLEWRVGYILTPGS